MGLDPTVLRAMADAGASTEVILAAIEAQAVIDAERLAAQRAGNAERQQRFRDKRSARKALNGSNALRAVTPPIEEIIPPVSSDDETTAKRKSYLGKPDGVTEQTWSDFTAMRRAQKAPVSATVVAGIQREAEKAGWTLEAALGEAVSRGWRGFKAIWVAEQKQSAAEPASFLDHYLAKQAMAP